MTTTTITEQNVAKWLQGPYDERDKAEIRRLQKEDPNGLIEAFYKNLEFGTGGMRGIMGVGTNRINRYTVGFVTQAIANYVHTLDLPKKVAVCFDSRNYSKEYAEEVAKILAANEIEVFLFKELRPVALISFAVRENQCAFGVMITASHNPPLYNGYKVYGPDGSQVLEPHDKKIVEVALTISSPNQIKIGELSHPKIHLMGKEMDEKYFDAIATHQYFPKQDRSHGKELHIVYTPLHGAGMTLLPQAFAKWGFTNVSLVKEQTTFDGNFPTVVVPNPEEREALQMGVSLLKECKGDCLLATDPDTDRFAVAIREGEEIIYFNGNEMASMLLEHICHSLVAEGKMPPKAIAIKTIVTTELFKAIAEHYGVISLEVLTGFKYIGQRMSQFDEEDHAGVATHHFIFGAEESYGALVGRHVRDKDAIICSLLVAELALQMKLQGKNLQDYLYEIYKKYGIWREKLLSMTFPGKEGLETMLRMMKRLREKHPQTLGEHAVLIIEDYLRRERHELQSGKKTPILLPESDVLRFWLSDGSSLVMRPSGTEPKIKLYCSVHEKHHIHNLDQLKSILNHLDEKAALLLHALKETVLT